MITISYGAGRKTLSMDGHEYDLNTVDKDTFTALVGSLKRRAGAEIQAPRRKK